MIELHWRTDLTDSEAERARGLMAVEGLEIPRGGEHLLATRDGLVGYAHLDTVGDSFGNQVAELVVRPDARRQGVGGRMLAALAERARPLRVWSHEDHPGAARLAAAHGFDRVRELHRMGMDFGPELPGVVVPDGVRLRAFVPGRDERAVVDVNARAFSWHPEQGALTVGDVLRTEQEGWFDPAGFFLAVDADDRLLGFHWTKVHPDRTGEVYVVGVDPDAQGRGLGRVLTLAGLHHLRGLGLPRVILYVESDNTAAVTVYTKLGFRLLSVGVQYAR